jgi:hypothetical protein
VDQGDPAKENRQICNHEAVPLLIGPCQNVHFGAWFTTLGYEAPTQNYIQKAWHLRQPRKKDIEPKMTKFELDYSLYVVFKTLSLNQYV